MYMPKKIKDLLILVVDDNPQNLQVMGNILKEQGYKVAVAQNGLEALAFLEKKDADLILLDMMMPKMDGLETCKAIKENEKTIDIPIIFITALSDSWNKLQAFEVGGVDYITKPFMKEEVIARVNVHLRLKAAMESLRAMAVTDEMTGTYNRRHAFEVLARETGVANRLKAPFSLCFIDVDNLKKLNDNHGHEAGDLLINEVVNGLKAAIRISDYLFRMGGDEFLLLLPNTEIEAAEKLVKRVHKELSKKEIEGLPIDFSYGFSMFSPDDNISAEALVQQADAAMYQQKEKKKGRRQ